MTRLPVFTGSRAPPEFSAPLPAMLPTLRSIPPGVAPRSQYLHGDDADHSHEFSTGLNGAMIEYIRKMDNVILTTVGIDIGSSTSHLMFARVHLRRKANSLSSQFVVISREILWRSPIVITPFTADNTIDAARLKVFIDEAYVSSGLRPEEIDTGAVILTGEAIKKTNAHAIADLFAEDAGKFVCASAGHHLECTLAANGSGAVAMSRKQGNVVLHVDIGGGTTKLALIERGEILGTCAIAVGGRLLVRSADGEVLRMDDTIVSVAQAHGISMALHGQARPDDVERIVVSLADAVIALIRQQPVASDAQDLFLTSLLPSVPKIDAVTFSGGVSEYIYGREAALFGDLGKPLAERIRAAFDSGVIAIPLADPGHGIRATVIGASQFTVQVSGKTIYLSDRALLPRHNIPVLAPHLDLDATIAVADIAAAIGLTLAQVEPDDERMLALALKWRGEPIYWRLRALADGLMLALAAYPVKRPAIVLIIDGDIAQTLAHILKGELGLTDELIAVDGIELRSYDYVDLGELILPANVVPVVIKSLLFSAGQ